MLFKRNIFNLKVWLKLPRHELEGHRVGRELVAIDRIPLFPCSHHRPQKLERFFSISYLNSFCMVGTRIGWGKQYLNVVHGDRLTLMKICFHKTRDQILARTRYRLFNWRQTTHTFIEGIKILCVLCTFCSALIYYNIQTYKTSDEQNCAGNGIKWWLGYISRTDISRSDTSLKWVGILKNTLPPAGLGDSMLPRQD